MAARIDERTQFVDTGGNPVVAGSIFIGENGLDPEINPITIYSDRELTTVIANPQTLDEYGRSSNKIWIPGKYSMKVTDVDDVQLLQDLDAGVVTEVGNTILTDVLGADIITANAVNTITSYVDGQTYIFTVAANNTGPVTLNIDSLGAKAIQKNYTAALVADDFVATYEVVVVYNGDNDVFQWVNLIAEPAGFPIDYLAGGALTLSAGTTDTVANAAGFARDNTNVYDMTLTAFTKDMSAAWVVGDTFGGLFTGSLVAFEAYDVYVILLDADFETVDYGCDLVANGITNFPAGYTNYRLLGRFYTDADAAILEEIISTNDEGFPVGYGAGGVASIGLAATTAITGVTSGTNGPRFAFVAGPTNTIADTVTISGFTTNTAYNGTFQVGIVNAAYFEVNDLTFGTDETGVFQVQDFNLLAITDAAARDDLNTFDMIGAAMQKDISATWVVGDGNGGLFTGTVAADTVYYYFAIRRDVDGAIDYGFDTSIIAANIPTGYTAFKFVSRLLTDSGSELIDSVQGAFVSDQTSMIGNSTTVFAHGLGTRDIEWTPELIIRTATSGYVIGDIVPVPIGLNPWGGTSPVEIKGTSFDYNSTEATIHEAANGSIYSIISKSNGLIDDLADTEFYYRLNGKVR